MTKVNRTIGVWQGTSNEDFSLHEWTKVTRLKTAKDIRNTLFTPFCDEQKKFICKDHFFELNWFAVVLVCNCCSVHEVMLNSKREVDGTEIT